MESALKYNKNCYNLSTVGDGSVIDWSPNITKEKIFVVQPAVNIPELFYWRWNDTHYQWCGPMLMIAEYFAKFTNAKIRLLTQIVAQEYLEKASNGIEALPHVGLLPGDSSMYNTFIKGTIFEEFANLSTMINYHDMRVLSPAIIGKPSLYEQFECFDVDVYYGIFVSLLVISSVICLNKQTLKSFLSSFWTYFSVILSDSYSIRMNTTFDRLLSGVWLLTCTVLLAAFSGQLRETFLKEKIILSIQNFEDLINGSSWKYLKIQAASESRISNMIRMEENGFEELKSRTNETIFKDSELLDGNKSYDRDLDYTGMKNGETAIYWSFFCLEVIKKNLISIGLIEGIDFKISQSEQNLDPFFNIFNNLNFNYSYQRTWNFVIGILKESGIHDQLRKIGLNPNRIGPDFNELISTNENQVEDIYFAQMKGILILYTTSLAISIFFILFEILMKYVLYKIDH